MDSIEKTAAKEIYPKRIIIIAGIVILVGGLYALFATYNKAQNMKNNPPAENIAELKSEIIREGEGEAAKAGDTVSVHYIGKVLNSPEHFDSSYDRGKPFVFTLGAGQVIVGWDQGVAGMKVGEKRKLTIPPSMGYGGQGVPDAGIPPNAVLVFDIEMVAID